MGLLDSLTKEDDIYAKEGVKKDFGNILALSGGFKSFNSSNIKWTVIYYINSYALVAFHLILLGYTMYLMYPDISQMSNTLHMVLLLCIVLVIIHSVIGSQHELEKLLRYFYRDSDIYFYSYDRVIQGFREERDRYSGLIVRSMVITVSVSACILLLVGPLLNYIFGNNILRCEHVLYDIPLPIYWPWRDDYIFKGFLPVVSETVVTLVGGSLIGGYLMIYFSICLHLYFQLKVLLHNIQNIEAHSRRCLLLESGCGEIYNYASPVVTKHLESFIKDIVAHHTDLIKLTNCFVKWPLLSAFLSGSVDIAMAGLVVLLVKEQMGTTVVAIVFCLVELCLFGAITFISDWVTELSEQVHREIYRIKWYSMRQRVKSSVLIIESCNIKPLQIMAGYTIPVDKAMYGSILQTAYSYINLISAIK